jgi:hypothetical protein
MSLHRATPACSAASRNAIVVGLGSGQGDAANFQTASPVTSGGVMAFFAALVAALWAYRLE